MLFFYIYNTGRYFQIAAPVVAVTQSGKYHSGIFCYKIKRGLKDSESECHEKRGEDTMSEQKLWHEMYPRSEAESGTFPKVCERFVI